MPFPFIGIFDTHIPIIKVPPESARAILPNIYTF